MKTWHSSGCAIVGKQAWGNHVVRPEDFNVGGTSVPTPASGKRWGLEPRPQSGRRRHLLALVMVVALSACSTTPAPAPVVSSATTFAQAGLVDIRSLVPDIAEDIRYAGADNFIGVPIDGYRAPRCYLRQSAARALQQVERALRNDGFRLQVFDCYRPARAVRHFVRWGADLQDQRTRPRHYPNLDKQALLGDYIAPVSGHSRGATVDLTLLDCRNPDGQCLALDMGTEFDFFDPRANTDSAAVTSQQRENRQRLLKAMAREGFRNYPMEWWHFSLPSAQSPAIHDLPIE